MACDYCGTTANADCRCPTCGTPVIAATQPHPAQTLPVPA